MMLENIERASPCRKNNLLVKKPLKKGKWLDVVMKAIFLPKVQARPPITILKSLFVDSFCFRPRVARLK